jgi:DNA replication and repair protein RecF
LYLRRLLLKDFRNYSDLDLSLPRGNLVFLGDNAQGKSNLLEAVYLLASARSVRASSDVEMVGWQAPAEPQPVARVAGSLERRDGAVQLEAFIAGRAPGPAALAARAGKRLRLNGIPRRAADFVGSMRAVLFTADDLAIVSGAPSERRRYLDSMLVQVDRRYYAANQRYARVLQQRNAALKRVKDGLAGPEELGFWDESLVTDGAVIIATRARACALLAPEAARQHLLLSGAAGERLELRYRPRLADGEKRLPETEEEAAAALKAALHGLKRREVAAGMSLAGPHRDDLEILLDGAAAASFGSRAQVRTAALSLRLAEAALLRAAGGDPPLLLLDDIVSELDERRRRSVLTSIADFDQVWFTATDTHGFDPAFLETAAVYRVQSGRVLPLGQDWLG